MNIFVVDEDPVIAASMLPDVHVSKMILETAQMLSAVSERHGFPSLYGISHANHPCTLWAGNTKENFQWLADHGLALEAEKIRRTGVGHKSAEVIRWYIEREHFPKSIGLTPFYQAVPDKYKQNDAVLAYREYFVGEKQFAKNGKRPKWTNASPPDWWKYK